VLRAAITHVEAYTPRTEYNYFNSAPGLLAREEAHFRTLGMEENEISDTLRKAGVTIEYTVEVEAPAGREFRLMQTLYRASTEEAVSPINGHFPDEHFVARAGRYESTESSWIEYPARPGQYFVEIDLIDMEGHNIARPGRSRTFDVPSP
jgi:hypothetical protein